jgi:hypothetical protein
MKAIDVGRRNPGALFGAFAIVLLVGLVPSGLQMVLQATLTGQPVLMWSLYALVMLASLLVMPPLMGGAIRVLHACESGQPVSALDVLQGYRDTSFAVRMVLTSLLLLLVSVVVIGLLFALLPGKELFVELFARSMSVPPGGQPDMSGLPEFDPSSLPWIFLWFVGAAMAVFTLMHAQFLAYSHAALGGHGPVDAVAAGFVGTLKNALPLTGFTLAMLVIGFVLIMIVAVVVGLLAVALTLVGPVVAGVVLVPIYLVVMLLMYVVMFGFYYHGWREIFGEMAADPMDAISA